MKFNPLFLYDIDSQNLLIKISDDDNDGLPLKLISPPKNKSIISKISSLTLPQKHCLIFLACSVLLKRSCVIQGDTASGKSHIVRLFAELIGAPLNVFQVNNDSNVSMLAGQSILKEELSPDNVADLKNALSKLIIDENIRQYIENTVKIDINDPSTFSPESLKKLLNYIKNEIEPNIQEKNYFNIIMEAIYEIKQIMNPVNRFEHIESVFIHAIRNGEWVLIDGIESAPSIIAEKISSLCGDKPELNLYEYGKNFIFSKDDKSLPNNKIHPNFQLFITFNQNSMKESQVIDQTFLVKSLTFTLPPFDEKVENSAQMLFGSLINLKYSTIASQQLACRFASMHQYAKEESKDKSEDFTCDIQFNGRTLKFVTKAFSIQKQYNDKNKKSDIIEPICFSTKSFYWNSYINNDPEKIKRFHDNCITKLKDEPNKESLTNLVEGEMTPQIRNKKILIMLSKIQHSVLEKTPKSSYNLSEFLGLCVLIRISDLDFVQRYINDTIRIIRLKSNEVNNFVTFGSLNAVNTLFKDIASPDKRIKKEHSFLKLNENELRNNKSILTPLTKFDLLCKLSDKKLFSEKSSVLLENDLYLSILDQISIIASTFDKNLIVELFKQIDSDNSLITFVDNIFPYFLFKESKLKMISYWLPLFKDLITNNVHFSLTINDTKFDFNQKSTYNFSFDLIMNEKETLSLSNNTTFYFDSNNDMDPMTIDKDNEEQNDLIDYIHYCLMRKMFEKRNQSFDLDFIYDVLTKSANMY